MINLDGTWLATLRKKTVLIIVSTNIHLKGLQSDLDPNDAPPTYTIHDLSS